MISPVIATSASTGMSARRRHDRRCHRDTGRGAILGDGAGRDVDVQILLRQEVRGNSELGRALPDVAEGGASGFLHHVAQLAGQYELAVARHQRRFDEEHVAAGLGPRDTGRHARP